MKHAFLSKIKIVLSQANISQHIEYCQDLSGSESTQDVFLNLSGHLIGINHFPKTVNELEGDPFAVSFDEHCSPVATITNCRVFRRDTKIVYWSATQTIDKEGCAVNQQALIKMVVTG